MEKEMFLKFPKLILKDFFSKEKKLNIAFVGMSGIGKTFWSRKISQDFGYKYIDFDSRIGSSKAFSDLIKDFPGKEIVEKVGNYFGKPWENDFKEKEKKYLEIEKKLIGKNFSPGTILDLTGSAIYHEEEMEKIKKNSLVIYLGITEEKKVEIFFDYKKNPKPVCFKNEFQIFEGKNKEESLAISYSNLLNFREKKFKYFSDLEISFEFHKNTKKTIKFLKEIVKKLEK